MPDRADLAFPVGEEVGISAPVFAQDRGPASGRRAGRRLAVSYLVTVFVLVSVNFLLPRALPGDPISALIDPSSPAGVDDEALLARLEQYYGLDRPLLAQYGNYLADLARGDLGVSIRYNVPVGDLVIERLPWTLLLIVSAVGLAVVAGWIAGIHSAWRRGRRVDRGLLVLFLTMHSFPVFFVGSLAAYVFAVKLGWFPLAGTRTPFAGSAALAERVGDILLHLVLPASVLAANFVTSQYLNMRASMVGQLGADYLIVGRAKGLGDHRLKYRYAARNALLPVVTITAVHVSFAVTAGILVETVFAYQGLGRLMFDAVAFRDYPTLQGCFLVLSLVVVTANFLADAVYGRLDPRTRT